MPEYFIRHIETAEDYTADIISALAGEQSLFHADKSHGEVSHNCTSHSLTGVGTQAGGNVDCNNGPIGAIDAIDCRFIVAGHSTVETGTESRFFNFSRYRLNCVSSSRELNTSPGNSELVKAIVSDLDHRGRSHEHYESHADGHQQEHDCPWKHGYP